MPPARRRSKSTNLTPTTNGDTVASLRQKCADEGLPTHGRRPVLVYRLQHHAESQAENTQSPEPRNTQSSPSESALSETQLAQIQCLVSRSVEQAIAEITSNTARAAVGAMTTPSLKSNTLNKQTNLKQRQPTLPSRARKYEWKIVPYRLRQQLRHMLTFNAKFFIFAMPPFRRIRARRNEESSAPSNVDTVRQQSQQIRPQTELKVAPYGFVQL